MESELSGKNPGIATQMPVDSFWVLLFVAKASILDIPG